MTLQLQPLYKRSITFLEKDDSDLGAQISTFGNQHEFADFTWFPSQKKVLYRIDDRVPYNTTGNGVFDFFGLSPVSSFLTAVSRTIGLSMITHKINSTLILISSIVVNFLFLFFVFE